jgi:lysozyme
MRRWILPALFAAGCSSGVGELNQAASTQQCPTTTVEGVDVYQGDSPIVWSTVKTSGRAFAFTKASQGNYNTQSNFDSNWSTLKSLGMLRGPYHYFDATVDGVAQANWFLQQLEQAGGLIPGDLPPALDLECPTSPNSNDPGNYCLGNGKSGWAPTATIIKGVWDWIHTVEAATGMKPVIYSYVSWFGDFGFTDPNLANYPLWIASVASTTCATIPAPWTKATFWQYSSKMHVPGIGAATTPADEDRFMGSQGGLNAFTIVDLVPDAGADGATAGPPDFAGGIVDLASSTVDLAGGGIDLASVRSNHAGAPIDLGAPRADASTSKVHSASGCGCQLGGTAPLPARWLALIVGLALSRRRRLR